MKDRENSGKPRNVCCFAFYPPFCSAHSPTGSGTRPRLRNLLSGISITVKPQSNLDYPDSLGPHEIVRIIKNNNINERLNPAKLIKSRKRHLIIVKQHLYKSFAEQAIEREISLRNNGTLSAAFVLWEQKTLVFDCTFQCCSFEKDIAKDLNCD